MDDYKRTGGLRYGTITKKSYHDGKKRAELTWLEESVAVADKPALLNQVLASLDMLLNEQTDEITITVQRSGGGQLRLVKKHLVK